jgi:hypothetical protein
MSALRCYRCGESLAQLSLPLRRLEECPKCRVHLHVCRMCVNFAPRLPTQCTEQDALEVRDKTNANFCDYFKPSAAAFDPAGSAAETRARAELDALFGKAADAPSGSAEATEPPEKALEDARALFKN